MNEYIARESIELPYRDHLLIITVLASDENHERAIHRAEAEADHYRELIDAHDKEMTENSKNEPTIDEDHIWTEKYEHKGGSFTRDKDIMAHLEKHRDIEWDRLIMDTHYIPPAKNKMDRVLDEIESLLSDEAREWWDCDECGHGGGGLCPRCKHESDRSE